MKEAVKKIVQKRLLLWNQILKSQKKCTAAKQEVTVEVLASLIEKTKEVLNCTQSEKMIPSTLFFAKQKKK